MNNQLLLHNGFAALSLWRKWQSVRRRMLWLHKACACLSKENCVRLIQKPNWRTILWYVVIVISC